jgi:hypothetical protein
MSDSIDAPEPPSGWPESFTDSDSENQTPSNPPPSVLRILINNLRGMDREGAGLIEWMKEGAAEMAIISETHVWAREHRKIKNMHKPAKLTLESAQQGDVETGEAAQQEEGEARSRGVAIAALGRIQRWYQGKENPKNEVQRGRVIAGSLTLPGNVSLLVISVYGPPRTASVKTNKDFDTLIKKMVQKRSERSTPQVARLTIKNA